MEPVLIEILGIKFLLPWYVDKIFYSAIIGIVIGLEREFRGKHASLRTFSAICVGSCIFTVLSVEAAGGANGAPYDMTRIAAQIVSGIGFLGGGVIFKTTDRIEGITTGALIWLTAALGMACGFGQTEIALWAFFIGFFAHVSMHFLYLILDALRNKGLIPDK